MLGTICNCADGDNGMSIIFQQSLKQLLLKHCDHIASSLELVGSGSNEPVSCGLNEPLAGLVRF